MRFLMLYDIIAAFFILKFVRRPERAQSNTAYSDLQALFLAARYGRGEGAIVEVGSYKGRSAIALGAGSKSARRGEVQCIDPHREGTRDVFLKNVAAAGVADYCRAITAVSEQVVPDFHLPVRLVFIDGNHEYAQVKKDIGLWKDKVIDGGIMAFHDYTRPDVARAIAELLAGGGFIREAASGCTLFISKGRRENHRLFATIGFYNRLKNGLLLRGFRDE